jgi:hypothetical protein
MNPFFKWLTQLVLLTSLALAGAGVAWAQAEPSMNQIYATAQAGKLDEAQAMVQQVLVTHPKSAKAFYVRAELYARQGKKELAREALASAEHFAPGLPFAKPAAVQALKAELAARPSASYAVQPSATAPVTSSAPSSGSWVLPLALAAGVIGVGYFVFRRRNPQPALGYPAYDARGGLNGPQTFGMGPGGAMAPSYPQGSYGPGPMPTSGSGLGGQILGGVATGLAVGAGVMAAEAIGRNLMGEHHAAPAMSPSDTFEPVAPNVNADMGGNNFGISDTSWDNGGSDAGGGSDWDN